ncbi:MAG: hypothetical protein D6688_01960 [Alphaproteobacteria bacterium]|nr:MAG: hypothetical protein D6688_01960 [Alphaproteobacteria bacterium]
MVETLARHYDRIRVIAYVRPYRSLMASGFQQRLQGGLRQFLPRVPAYRRRLEPWREAVGADNMTLRKFDRQCLRDGDIVADFAEWLGVSAEGLPRRVDNTSLSAEGAALLFLFNRAPGLPKAPARRTAMRKALARALAGVGPHRLAFPEALMTREAAAMADDIRWVEEVAGFSVSDPLRPDPRAIEVGDEAAFSALGLGTVRRLRAALAGKDDIAPPETARHILRRLRRVGAIGPAAGRGKGRGRPARAPEPG